MDKLALNNEIVSLRKTVRRVKVLCINKLVRSAQELKKKKGTDEQKEKNNNKASRLLEEVQLIKRVKIDDITKFALQNKKTLTEVAQNPKTPLEERGMVRLSEHPKLAEPVQKFREKYPRWSFQIPALLRVLGLRQQKKKKASADKVPDKELEWKLRFESSEEEEEEDDDDDEICGSDYDITEINKLDFNRTEDGRSTSDNEEDGGSDTVGLDVDAEVMKAIGTDKVENEFSLDALRQNAEPIVKPVRFDTKVKVPVAIKNTIARVRKTKPVVVAEKHEGTVEVRRLKLNELSEEDNLFGGDSGFEENKESEGKPTHRPVSSFFLLEGEEERQSEEEIGSEGGSDHEKSEPPTGPRQPGERNVRRNFAQEDRNFEGRFMKGRERKEKEIERQIPMRGRFGQRFPGRGFPARRGRTFETFQKSSRGHPGDHRFSKDYRPSRARVDEVEKKPAEDYKAHPSWEAKRKLKEQSTKLHVFEGKKIKFDD